MATILDVNANKLINEAGKVLKSQNIVNMPDWANFVKTGTAKMRCPIDGDWWYYRAASILRKVYLDGPIGVSKLRTKYGSKKNRGHKPEEFRRASGKIIRLILQQLEKAELVKTDLKDIHKGRKITPKGKSFLDKIATTILPKFENKE
ncbi:30S ribosomal protein S19e [Candidatus Woesearchaeota archaeon]|nr:30S ribosomal protein S19e [Candidatus Woesearchaeota archaeon]